MKLTDRIYYYPEHGMLDCNTYLIKGQTVLLIDPGYHQFLPQRLEAMRRDGFMPQEINIIANTHLHVDHYWGDQALKEASGARVMLHPRQKISLAASVYETTRFFGMEPVEIKEDGLFAEKSVSLEDMEIEFIQCPGHSPDSICFYSRTDKFLVCGDVLFAGNTGRVDLPSGSAEELKASINRLSELDIEYLLPGHMGIVSGAARVKNNFEFVKENVFPYL